MGEEADIYQLQVAASVLLTRTVQPLLGSEAAGRGLGEKVDRLVVGVGGGAGEGTGDVGFREAPTLAAGDDAAHRCGAEGHRGLGLAGGGILAGGGHDHDLPGSGNGGGPVEPVELESQRRVVGGAVGYGDGGRDLAIQAVGGQGGQHGGVRLHIGPDGKAERGALSARVGIV